MPKGISLTGGFAAEGAGLGLEKIIEQRLLREKFLEAQRQAQAQEAFQQQRHALDQQQFGYMQQRDTADREMRTRERGEDRAESQRRFGIERSEFDTAAQERQFNREMGVKEKGEERELRAKERKEDREFEASERAKDRALRASLDGGTRGGGKTKEQLDAVSDMVLQNPDLLKDFTPTDRSRILGHIATNKEGALPNKRVDSMRSMLDASLTTVKRLKEPSGMSGAIGAKGPTSLFGLLEQPMAGSNAADYATHVDALKSQLTLPRMEMMRGLGAMSDREFKTLSDSATALSRNMSEAEFTRELGNIERTLTAVQSRLGGAASGGSGPAVGEIRMINGQRARWDGKGWLAAP